MTTTITIDKTTTMMATSSMYLPPPTLSRPKEIGGCDCMTHAVASASRRVHALILQQLVQHCRGDGTYHKLPPHCSDCKAW